MRRLMNDGWQPMGATQGCGVMAQLLAAERGPQVGVIPLDWSQFSRQVPGASGWPVLTRLMEAVDGDPAEVRPHRRWRSRQNWPTVKVDC